MTAAGGCCLGDHPAKLRRLPYLLRTRAGNGLFHTPSAGDPESRRDREAQLKGRRLWLEEAEGMMSSCFLALWSLWPIWHALRGMFGLALLFYGQEFATLAFHIVVFRLSGWKKVET